MYHKHVESWAQTGMLSSKKKKKIHYISALSVPSSKRKEGKGGGEGQRKTVLFYSS